ncbi:unnamed protein product [Adineta steineri]|uniref:Uncharacterized protein n=1 Tax=Adineta steineri TaxID=433720 RepID=A0A814LSL6_9BILA|nr:unnamed protein product [Adineta steineri]CAF1171243.1 unnamed protein product [Adineta steineri]CAF3534677.1 unnamed protein product [Adineta steineri]CAF3623241.1 unnamed protein product [Adineta steineri]
MRTTLINTILCFFIVMIGITLSSSMSVDNDEHIAASNMDWSDGDNYYPSHQLDLRAAKSRFWKRAPNRHFWKRSISNE